MHASQKRVLVRTTDTDVVILAISVVHTLDVEELWIVFGTGKYQLCIPAHEIAGSIGPQRSRTLVNIHA